MSATRAAASALAVLLTACAGPEWFAEEAEERAEAGDQRGALACYRVYFEQVRYPPASADKEQERAVWERAAERRSALVRSLIDEGRRHPDPARGLLLLDEAHQRGAWGSRMFLDEVEAARVRAFLDEVEAALDEVIARQWPATPPEPAPLYPVVTRARELAVRADGGTKTRERLAELKAAAAARHLSAMQRSGPLAAAVHALVAASLGTDVDVEGTLARAAQAGAWAPRVVVAGPTAGVVAAVQRALDEELPIRHAPRVDLRLTHAARTLTPTTVTRTAASSQERVTGSTTVADIHARVTSVSVKKVDPYAANSDLEITTKGVVDVTWSGSDRTAVETEITRVEIPAVRLELTLRGTVHATVGEGRAEGPVDLRVSALLPEGAAVELQERVCRSLERQAALQLLSRGGAVDRALARQRGLATARATKAAVTAAAGGEPEEEAFCLALLTSDPLDPVAAQWFDERWGVPPDHLALILRGEAVRPTPPVVPVVPVEIDPPVWGPDPPATPPARPAPTHAPYVVGPLARVQSVSGRLAFVGTGEEGGRYVRTLDRFHDAVRAQVHPHDGWWTGAWIVRRGDDDAQPTLAAELEAARKARRGGLAVCLERVRWGLRSGGRIVDAEGAKDGTPALGLTLGVWDMGERRRVAQFELEYDAVGVRHYSIGSSEGNPTWRGVRDGEAVDMISSFVTPAVEGFVADFLLRWAHVLPE